MRRWRFRVPGFVLTALMAGAGPSAHAQQPRAIVDQYCTGCHNSKLKTGGLAFDSAVGDNPADHPEIWEKVVRRLRVRSMHRRLGLLRPSDATYVSLIGALESSLGPRTGRDASEPWPYRHVPPLEPHRISKRHSRSAGTRNRCRAPVAERRCEFWVRQCHGGRALPYPARTLLRFGRTQDQPPCARQPEKYKSPNGDTVTYPPDLTQEEHAPTSFPWEPEGAWHSPTPSAVDAEYEIQVRLTRDRNEHVEGTHGKDTGGIPAGWQHASDCLPSSRPAAAKIITR